MTVTVTDRCAGCGGCLLTCPTRAFRPVVGTLHVVDELCTGCLECLEICPADAIEERPGAHSTAANGTFGQLYCPRVPFVRGGER